MALQVILKYYKNLVFLVAKYDIFWLVHDTKQSDVATTVYKMRCTMMFS